MTHQEEVDYVNQVMKQAQAQAVSYLETYQHQTHSKEDLIELCCMLIRLYAVDPLNH